MRSSVVFGVILLVGAVSARGGDVWPQFRGPNQDGVSDSARVPVKWSETENVKFKVAIPGEGWSSPVVAGEQVWVTTATEDGKSLRAVCIQKDSGSVAHDVEVFRVEHPVHKNAFNSHASPTPVVEA